MSKSKGTSSAGRLIDGSVSTRSGTRLPRNFFGQDANFGDEAILGGITPTWPTTSATWRPRHDDGFTVTAAVWCPRDTGCERGPRSRRWRGRLRPWLKASRRRCDIPTERCAARDLGCDGRVEPVYRHARAWSSPGMIRNGRARHSLVRRGDTLRVVAELIRPFMPGRRSHASHARDRTGADLLASLVPGTLVPGARLETSALFPRIEHSVGGDQTHGYDERGAGRAHGSRGKFSASCSCSSRTGGPERGRADLDRRLHESGAPHRQSAHGWRVPKRASC